MGSVWTDLDGVVRKTPSSRRRMNYTKVALHAAVRSYVMRRDGFTCKRCGRACSTATADYDGFEAIMSDDWTLLVVDHRVSLRLGGTNHPDNLQTLCDPCNARKSCTEEGAGRVSLEGK